MQTVRQIIVMGVAGSGKTAVGRALAEALGWSFLEGDDFHPASNVAKMSEGVPLDDADREPWLAALHKMLVMHEETGAKCVLSCSALKRSYREQLQSGLNATRFVYLDVSREVLETRLARRPGHFMKADMLDSQLAALEVPGEHEALHVAGDRTVQAIVEDIVSQLVPG